MTSSRSLEELTAADFRDVKGTRFKLTTESREPGSPVSLEFELADVTEAGANLPAPFRRPFSVLFHGPIEPILPQAIYRLEHDRFGAVDLFLVPVGPDPSAVPTVMRYEAVFG